MKNRFFIALILLFVSSLNAEESLRVINGNDASVGEYPWMVSILGVNEEPVFDLISCGGTLVDKRYVLTAAHCLFDVFGDLERASSFSVLSSKTVLSSPNGVRTKVARLIPHPDYDDNQFVPIHDIALLRLKDELDEETLQIAKDEEGALLTPGTIGTVLGWGITHPNALNIFPDVLQEGEMPILEDDLCTDRMGLIFRPKNMICASKLSTSSALQDGVDTCSGDSGGPLLVSDSGTFKQVGITSFGFRCEDTYFPGAYTEIPFYYDWITEVITVPNTIESLLEQITNLLKKVRKRKRRRKRALRVGLKGLLAQLGDVVTESSYAASASLPNATTDTVNRLRRHVTRATSSKLSSGQKQVEKKRAQRVIDLILS